MVIPFLRFSDGTARGPRIVMSVMHFNYVSARAWWFIHEPFIGRVLLELLYSGLMGING